MPSTPAAERIDIGQLNGWITSSAVSSLSDPIQKKGAEYHEKMEDVATEWRPLDSTYTRGPYRHHLLAAMDRSRRSAEAVKIQTSLVSDAIRAFEARLRDLERERAKVLDLALEWNATVTRGEDPQHTMSRPEHTISNRIDLVHAEYQTAVDECAEAIRRCKTGGETFSKEFASRTNPDAFDKITGLWGAPFTPAVGAAQKTYENAVKKETHGWYTRRVEKIPKPVRTALASKHKLARTLKSGRQWEIFELNRLTTGLSLAVTVPDAMDDARDRLRVQYPDASDADINRMAALEGGYKGGIRVGVSTIGGGVPKSALKQTWSVWKNHPAGTDLAFSSAANALNRKTGVSSDMADRAWNSNAVPLTFPALGLVHTATRRQFQAGIERSSPEAPRKYAVPEPPTPRPRTSTPTPPKPKPNPYVVKEGDTLDAIATRYKLETVDGGDAWRGIHGMNGQRITNPNQIHPGQKLVIPDHPLSSGRTGTESGRLLRPEVPNNFTVRQGDTLSQIAESTGYSMAQLQRANPGLSSRIHPGQMIILPKR